MSPRRRRSFGTIRDTTAYGGKVSGERNDTRPPGLLAWFDGTCATCDRPIQRHVHQVIERKHEWIHIGCASGADE